VSRPIRLAIVMHHPAQHFAPAFRRLSGEAGVDVQVYYWSVARSAHDTDFGRSVSWDVDLLGGYAWAAPPSGQRVTGKLCWLFRQFRSARPDVVICYGWAATIARATIGYCTFSRTRLLLYSDATWQHASRGRHPVLRPVALRLLMWLCAGAVSTGTINREFYIRHGMDPRRIWPGVCPADTESFASARAYGAAESRAEGQPLQIGFAGKLIARKGADELLGAASLLPRSGDWTVTVIGDGPLLRELQTLAARLGVQDRVTFHGFANTSEMPKLLAACDVVVVPSRLDLRVLITIEAMAAGAAIVVSDATAVWGPGDLVEHQVTGLVYPSGDPVALARELRRLLTDRALLARIRRAGAERAQKYGSDAFTRAVASAARRCLEAGRQ
jgi:glycosyltransferase involved in cell wall biosynthesis